jgi:hypothetical protein
MTNVITVSDRNTNQKLHLVTSGTIPWFLASIKLVMNRRGIKIADKELSITIPVKMEVSNNESNESTEDSANNPCRWRPGHFSGKLC